MVLCGSSLSQTTDPDKAEITKAIAKECEDVASVIAEVRLRKWDERSKEIGRPISQEQRDLVHSVMRDQCVSTRLVVVLRMLRAGISAPEWSKLRGDAQIEELLRRIEKLL